MFLDRFIEYGNPGKFPNRDCRDFIAPFTIFLVFDLGSSLFIFFVSKMTLHILWQDTFPSLQLLMPKLGNLN